MKAVRSVDPNMWEMTEEIKEKISKSMKKFMEENPDKCPYLQNHYSKGPSYPEKYFSKCFGNKFQSKFRILNYELDFCDPINKIDIEIDGEQHFSDPRIRDHDKKRNKVLIEMGWSIIRVRWSKFKILNKQDKISVINSIISNQDSGFNCCVFLKSNTNPEKENLFYSQNKLISPNSGKLKFIKFKKCPDCGIEISIDSCRCKKCSDKNQRKVSWPSKEELEKGIWEKPAKHLAKKYGVSDNTIAKWCKIHGIKKPGRGYWKK